MIIGLFGIAQVRRCGLAEADKIWQVFVDEGKVSRNGFGLREWTR